MTALEKLAEFLRHRHPNAVVEIQWFRAGNAVMDIRTGPRLLVVQWKPGSAFRLWNRAADDRAGWIDFSQRADERLPTLAAARRRLSELLGNSRRRQPA